MNSETDRPITSVAEQMFYITTKITTLGPLGLGSGTGFFFGKTTNQNIAIFLVTNKHVVEGATEISFVLHLTEDGTTPSGQYTVVVRDPLEAVWLHPDESVDIAVFPFASIYDYVLQETGRAPFLKALTEADIPNLGRLQELDYIEEVLCWLSEGAN